MLKVLAQERTWITLSELCRRADISSTAVGSVNMSLIRKLLKDKIEVSTERNRFGRAMYYLSHIEEGVLPRCSHCGELI